MPSFVQGQYHSHRHTADRLSKETENLKNETYPYVLPFLGKKAQSRGYDLPRPIGIMLNYNYAVSEVEENGVRLSLDDEDYTDVSDLLSFSLIRAKANVVTIRPDIWILPFWNINGLVGYYDTETTVNLQEPFELGFLAQPSGPLTGVGTTLAGGIGPIFVSYEYTATWNFADQFLVPNFTQVNGIRIGHQFKSTDLPGRSLTLWMGAESVHLRSNTQGKVNLTEVAGSTPEDRAEAADDLQDWYNNLPPARQQLLQPIYDRVYGWMTNGEPTLLYYEFDKALKTQWNLVLGGQLQLSKAWQLVTEVTTFGTRYRFTTSLSYRFGF